MKAFKGVLDFAAKEYVPSDSQKDWKAWSSKNIEKKEEDEDEEKEAEESSRKRSRQIEEEACTKKWIELQDANNRTYWFDQDSGNTTYTKPNEFVLVEAEKESRETDELVNNLDTANFQTRDSQGELAVEENIEPQEWEKRRAPLTRKLIWYCQDSDIILEKEPLPHPWRAVKDDGGNVYFWNTKTGETRWP